MWTVREENGLAALEVMSRFAANPAEVAGGLLATHDVAHPEQPRNPDFLSIQPKHSGYFRREAYPASFAKKSIWVRAPS